MKPEKIISLFMEKCLERNLKIHSIVYKGSNKYYLVGEYVAYWGTYYPDNDQVGITHKHLTFKKY